MISTNLVSVIIPVYNSEKYLEQTINSVLKQTYSAIEVILIDDGSTDNSFAVCNNFKDRKLVKIIRQSNKGASSARNQGIRHSSGDFIQFLDADDLLHPEKISEQMKLLSTAGRESVAFCSWGKFHSNPKITVWVNNFVNRNYDKPYEFLSDIWCRGEMVQPAAWLIPREVIDTAGLWDETLSLNDDGEYFCRVILSSSAILFNNKKHVFYRTGQVSSLSKRADRAAVLSQLDSYELCVQHTKAYQNIRSMKKGWGHCYSIFIYQHYDHFPDLCAEALEKAARLDLRLRPAAGGLLFQILARIVGFMRALKVKRVIKQTIQRNRN